jgi:hypothetical protein
MSYRPQQYSFFPLLFVANPGIQKAIGQVNSQVDEHKHRSEKEHYTAHEWIVSVRGSIQYETAHPWKRKYLLNDNRASD